MDCSLGEFFREFGFQIQIHFEIQFHFQIEFGFGIGSGLGDKTCDLSLHGAGGGSAICF